MKKVLGYFLGFAIFIVGIPALVAIAGFLLSVWSIVYMKRVGKGNPFDAMGHEVAPRTRHLMTDGPYKLSRNPMLSGTYLYYAGIVVALWNWWALLVFAAVAGLMTLQVRSYEKRLEVDFGDEYLAYKKRRGRFITLKK